MGSPDPRAAPMAAAVVGREDAPVPAAGQARRGRDEANRRQAGKPGRSPDLAWRPRGELLPRPPSVARPEELSDRAVRTHGLHPPVLIVDEAEERGSAPAAVVGRRTQGLPG